ncbi:hypothetical protein [Burkholderia contaminans]|uniref:hypothetical protein n=1 Tax=Burkholderia contaminans TaxID=488447 RepID=UPI000F579555|nr:hypothetical protein [Burkholderia contaminans]RQS91595.1 hypothetical protein DF035_33110 [Burkholderia contaminans]
MYCVYDGTVDIARPRLYHKASQANVAWDDEAELVVVDAYRDDEDVVEVMPYYGHDDQAVAFLTRASKSHMVITGPRDFLSAIEAQNEDQ